MSTYLITGTRILLGLCFLSGGLNGYLVILGFDPLLPTSDAPFIKALLETTHLLVLLKTMEVGLGLLLLLNRFIPAALLALLPIAVNILLFHIFQDRANLLNGVLVFGLEVVLLWAYRPYFLPLLAARATPN
ncbi:MAG: hypothetical protein ACO1OQ_12785 [Rufibacter sp.]